MIELDRDSLEHRVLVLTPTGKDAALTTSILEEAGIPCETAGNLDELGREIDRGAGAVVVSEEAFAAATSGALVTLLERQPPWSDLPLVVLTFSGADSPAAHYAVERFGNVSLLERPVRVAALVSAVRTALRARFRQYATRGHLLALEDADHRKDQFVAMLAHELRNPLAPIRNALGILRLTGRRDPSVDRVHEMMERQVNHMVRLVDDLLEVSRITTGKIELRKQTVDLATVIANAVETSQPSIDASRHELTADLPAQAMPVIGDPMRLSQIFANLLDNAAKYTDAPGRIRLTARLDGANVVVSVSDSGVGIASDVLPRVFDLFAQADGDSRRVESGLGIGLTLVKSLVELHGGSVEARSEGRGRGSEFTVRLPLSPEARQDSAVPSPSASPPAPRRILVVDDNRDAADSLALLLELLGSEVRIAYDGPAALRAIEADPPAVVFLDLGMSGMDGYEVARRIRGELGRDEMKLVAITGWGQEQDRRLSRAAGFDHHLTKPADTGALESVLAALDERA